MRSPLIRRTFLINKYFKSSWTLTIIFVSLVTQCCVNSLSHFEGYFKKCVSCRNDSFFLSFDTALFIQKMEKISYCLGLNLKSQACKIMLLACECVHVFERFLLYWAVRKNTKICLATASCSNENSNCSDEMWWSSFISTETVTDFRLSSCANTAGWLFSHCLAVPSPWHPQMVQCFAVKQVFLYLNTAGRSVNSPECSENPRANRAAHVNKQAGSERETTKRNTISLWRRSHVEVKLLHHQFQYYFYLLHKFTMIKWDLFHNILLKWKRK